MNAQYRHKDRPRVASLGMVLLAVLSLSGLCQFVPGSRDHTAPTLDEAGVDLTRFETHLETIRQALRIPGMSAAVVRDQELAWAKGFGYADLEHQVAAAPDTPYGLASVTKPIAAVLIMQLVEDGLIDLDAPISRYGVVVGNATSITVRHLMTHTSEGVPGTVHDYNGNRYALLGGVTKGATGKTFAELLSERVLLPLNMKRTALNPISSGDGSSSSDWTTLRRSLGWGEAYRHYPDVYRHLAKPYQFGAAYDIIPGMYHLYHSPAAGLVSSVTDLAVFDIALDQGLLLEDTTKAQMFAPAYSTYNNRRDLMYGLGWYVQDYAGLQLLWHAGRWPPSTSALYLKVPGLGLTFIVLANTDNLTVPFYSIGHGDVMTSALALSFFRHFIFPSQHGRLLDDVDWSRSEDELVGQLSAVRDGPARRLLERELWSFRQVYASVGRHDQAQKLWRVSLRAFPRSATRADSMFTNLPGKFEWVPPAIPAAAYHWISLGIVLWSVLVAVSWIGMLASLARTPGVSAGEWVCWLLGTIFLGPFALVAYRLARLSPGTGPLPTWRQAVGASILTITAYTTSWALAIALLRRLGGQRHPLVILGVSYLTPLLVSLAFLRRPFRPSASGTPLRKRVPSGLLVEVILLNVGFSVLFPLTMVIGERVLTTIPSVTSPFLWAMLCLIAVVGAVVQLPITYWLARPGYDLWPFGHLSWSPGMMPSVGEAWQQLVVSVVFMIGSLAITMIQIA